MGLLDSILGGIAGNALGRSRGIGGGRSNILIALMPIVLQMLAQRRGGGVAGGVLPGPSRLPGGGLTGSGGLGALAGLGGLGALLQQFQRKGYGDQVQSWVGTGTNQALPPEAVSQVFGRDHLSQIASEAGLSEDDTRTGLAELLPQVVDHFTPQGELPDSDRVDASISEFEEELQRRS